MRARESIRTYNTRMDVYSNTHTRTYNTRIDIFSNTCARETTRKHQHVPRQIVEALSLNLSLQPRAEVLSEHSHAIVAYVNVPSGRKIPHTQHTERDLCLVLVCDVVWLCADIVVGSNNVTE
jgi:hypothetical protein